MEPEALADVIGAAAALALVTWFAVTVEFMLMPAVELAVVTWFSVTATSNRFPREPISAVTWLAEPTRSELITAVAVADVIIDAPIVEPMLILTADAAVVTWFVVTVASMLTPAVAVALVT